MIDEDFARGRARLNTLEDALRLDALSGVPRAVGMDKQGAITIVLEEDRFEIGVADDWERRVGASGLTNSAAEALNNATIARFEESGITWETPAVAEVTSPDARVDAAVVQGFVDENRNATEAEFSAALDVLVERARQAALKRMNNRGPDELATVLLAPDGSVNQVVFDEDAIKGREGRHLASDVMAAVSRGQRALHFPLLSDRE